MQQAAGCVARMRRAQHQSANNANNNNTPSQTRACAHAPVHMTCARHPNLHVDELRGRQHAAQLHVPDALRRGAGADDLERSGARKGVRRHLGVLLVPHLHA